ncbi:hypothetical protein [Microbacterium rhizomatis]|uniref:DUF4386 family protein n=1 Tax=Microbacterium rhizomatis TaxID=1631477 RepID=A0A5J5J5R9_9MICO|nr:hypothetical protein [Microbacterium rhizomatis]KAA9111402.1 hypothetical protein F6B43_07455 [Microbacterium rhizomatis]
MRPVTLTWTIGGTGLVLCGVLGMLQYSLFGAGPVAGIVQDLVFAATVLLFALGLSKEASVVARRPLGVTALAVVALWPLVVLLANPLLPTMDAATFDAGLDAYRAAESILTAAFYVDILVSIAAALVAAVQIARAGVVPRPWRWAPLWAVIASVAAGVLPQLLFAFTGPGDTQQLANAAMVIGALGLLVRTLGLGVLALVLAARVPHRTVEVFRSA